MSFVEARARAMLLRDEVRRSVAEADDAVRRAVEERWGDRASVQQAVERMRAEVLSALEEEEGVLVPALIAADAWGAERVDLLAETHALVRDAVARVQQLFDEVGEAGAALGTQLRAALREIVHPLTRDERLVLNADVLRDDPIVVGQTDG